MTKKVNETFLQNLMLLRHIRFCPPLSRWTGLNWTTHSKRCKLCQNEEFIERQKTDLIIDGYFKTISPVLENNIQIGGIYKISDSLECWKDNIFFNAPLVLVTDINSFGVCTCFLITETNIIGEGIISVGIEGTEDYPPCIIKVSLFNSLKIHMENLTYLKYCLKRNVTDKIIFKSTLIPDSIVTKVDLFDDEYIKNMNLKEATNYIKYMERIVTEQFTDY